jgi:hypothetical protein
MTIVVPARANLCRYSLWPQVRLAVTTGLYLFCLLVYPNHLVRLYHFDQSISLVLAVTTASLWTLGIALCRLSCTVVVPYEWVWIMGLCLLSFNLRLFHDELVEGARIPFFSLFLCSRFSLIQKDVG